jgi:prepilin-type N-terminal cleavage/methylation domain-containing protein
MRSRAGFTLLEVMVAIVLTSLVALMAYGAARVSVEARGGLARHLRTVQEARAVREVLQDVLRNVRPPERPQDPKFILDAGRLSFAAAGAGPPFDADYDWLITVQPDSGGLQLVAKPIGRAPAAQLAFRLPGVTRWEVQVLAPGGSEWLPEWPTGSMMPRVVAVTLWNGPEQVGAPLQVALTPGSPTAVDEGYFEGYGD